MNSKCPTCGSCGMPMEKTEHYGGGNTKNSYCVHCTDKNGTLLSYETILKENAEMYQKEQGLDDNAALKYAKDFLATLPAWKKK